MDGLLLAQACSPGATVNLLVACVTPSIIYHRNSVYFGGWDQDERELRDRNQGKDGRLRLELSSEGRYALRALVYLAWLGERASADRISAEAHVPRRLLARIPASLSHAGLIQSEQGRGLRPLPTAGDPKRCCSAADRSGGA
jgi:Iron-dependent Transcriptional regulator